MTPALRLTWLGHSTVVIDIEGTRLITDPLLHRHAGVLRRRAEPPQADQYEPVDAVLLSHLHHDHCELPSLRRLGDAPVLTAPANARWLRKRGLAGVGLGEDGGWRPVGSGRVEVRLVRAVHGHRPMPHRPNAANGHLVRGERHSVWAVGDTTLYPEMDRVGDQVGRRLDVILVPIAGWGPRLSGGHMGPEEAAIACARSGARWAVPVHWGTLSAPLMHRVGGGAWIGRPLGEFVEALAEAAPGCTPVELRPGGQWSAPS